MKDILDEGLVIKSMAKWTFCFAYPGSHVKDDDVR